MDHDMPGMGGMSPPSPQNSMNNDQDHMMMGMGLTHMTFFWSKNAEILFSGWPGTRGGMYALALIIVFVVSLLVEWFSNCDYLKRKMANNGLVQITFLHGVKIALAYLLMLAVMSFNVGVFIVVVAGHTLGFFLFGNRNNSENACQA